MQFIPISEVDPVYFASAYLLGCGAGSAKAYRLLNAAMTNRQRAALAKFAMRGKEHLVLIRPYGQVLMLHTMHYADEIRSCDQLDHGANTSVGASELKLAERLIDDLSKDKLEADKFEDTYRKKILKVAEQKAAGQEVTTRAATKSGKVIDLMSALKGSFRTNKGGSSKDDEEIAHAERSGSLKKSVRRAPRGSRHAQKRRWAR
jgi:DNA end-binding protein Ku